MGIPHTIVNEYYEFAQEVRTIDQFTPEELAVLQAKLHVWTQGHTRRQSRHQRRPFMLYKQGE